MQIEKKSVQQRILAADKPEESDSEEEDKEEKDEDVSLEETKGQTDQSPANSEKGLSQSGFTILGGFEKKAVPKVLIPLPCRHNEGTPHVMGIVSLVDGGI